MISFFQGLRDLKNLFIAFKKGEDEKEKKVCVELNGGRNLCYTFKTFFESHYIKKTFIEYLLFARNVRKKL